MQTELDILDTLLMRYETMLALAEQNDWDTLADLGTECEVLRASLQRAGDFSARARPEDLPALRETLQAILAVDARIRTHTVPCLESTRQLLAGAVKDRNLRKAYGAGPG
jgi:hypothetical protein